VIRHVALFRFRPRLTDARRAAFHAAAAALGPSIPSVSAAVAGPNIRLQVDGFDYALMLDFADAAAFGAYKEHPEHLRFIEQQVRPCVEQTVRAQIDLVRASGSPPRGRPASGS
jgi:hypothetical protein